MRKRRMEGNSIICNANVSTVPKIEKFYDAMLVNYLLDCWGCSKEHVINVAILISPRVVKLWWWATMRKDYCTPPSCPDRAFFPFPPCPTFVFYCNIYGVFKVFLVEKVQRDFYFSHQTILKQNNDRISKQGVFKYANNSMAHLMQNIRFWNLKRKCNHH